MALSVKSYGTIAVAMAAASLLMEEEVPEKPKQIRKRSVWVSEWIAKRKTEGLYVKLLPELRSESPKLYQNFVRMSSEDFEYLLGLVAPLISKQDTQMRKSIPAGERLALTLRFLATGDNFMSLQYLFRIPETTISRIVPEVLDAIYTVLKDKFMKVPQTEAGWDEIAVKFNEVWNFPNCIGAVDGKHVVMNAPPNSGSVHYNYKGTHSIILMGIADAEYKLTYMDVGCNGRISDGGVYNKCSFKKALDRGQLKIPMPKPLPERDIVVPYLLVGDDAFAMKPSLLKPYSGRTLSGTQRVFNYRLSRARGKIENVFGLMSARFRVLRKPISLDADKTRKVAKSCCALHNFLMVRNKRLYAPNGSFDAYDASGALVPGEWRQNAPDAAFYPLETGTPYISEDAKKIREEFEQYFVNEGEVSWQYTQI